MLCVVLAHLHRDAPSDDEYHSSNEGSSDNEVAPVPDVAVPAAPAALDAVLDAAADYQLTRIDSVTIDEEADEALTAVLVNNGLDPDVNLYERQRINVTLLRSTADEIEDDEYMQYLAVQIAQGEIDVDDAVEEGFPILSEGEVINEDGGDELLVS